MTTPAKSTAGNGGNGQKRTAPKVGDQLPLRNAPRVPAKKAPARKAAAKSTPPAKAPAKKAPAKKATEPAATRTIGDRTWHLTLGHQRRGAESGFGRGAYGTGHEAYRMPKGYDMRWPHAGYDLLELAAPDQADRRELQRLGIEGTPKWLTTCNLHGTFRGAEGLKDAGPAGKLSERQVWCSGCRGTAQPAKKAAAAKQAQPAKKAEPAKQAAPRSPRKQAAKKTA